MRGEYGERGASGNRGITVRITEAQLFLYYKPQQVQYSEIDVIGSRIPIRSVANFAWFGQRPFQCMPSWQRMILYSHGRYIAAYPSHSLVEARPPCKGEVCEAHTLRSLLSVFTGLIMIGFHPHSVLTLEEGLYVHIGG